MAAHLQQPACYLQLRPRDIRVFPLAYLLRTDFLSLLATVRGTFQLTLARMFRNSGRDFAQNIKQK